MDAEAANQVRLHVLRAAMAGEPIPSARDAAAAVGLAQHEGIDAYSQLAQGHVYVLEPGDPERLRMANPFSAVPTDFVVEALGLKYHGNCIWDSLGIVSLMGGTGHVQTHCPDCGEELLLVVSEGRLVADEGVVHFSVPAAKWWDDILYT